MYPLKPLLRRIYRKLPPDAQRLTKQAYRKVSGPGARARMPLGIEPLSYFWGLDRGQEIARHYLEGFLREFAADIRGEVLEFFADDYTSKFGDGRFISRLDVLSLEADNPNATIVADLTQPNDIADGRFDCIICTHVLHVIYEFEKAIADMHRILRPGGVLLMAVPQMSMCSTSLGELWRFTEQGLRFALARSFPEDQLTMRYYGNSLTAAGEIRGLAAHEFTRRELDTHDVRFAVEICARAFK